MADAIIDRISPADVGTIAHLYNQVFRPGRTEAQIAARLRGQHNVLVQVARRGNDAIGVYVGMEAKPGVHAAWLVGVVPDMRRGGIASQLVAAAEDWAKAEGYDVMRFECENKTRAFMSIGVSGGYDVAGIRWDHERLANLVIFEKTLRDGE